MLGLAPIAALPLAAVNVATLAPIEEQLSATGGLTFSGSANAGAIRHLSASGGLTFGGSAFLSAWTYRSATGGITFSGDPLLRVAGKPWVFTALPESFQFRADGADYTHTALTVSFDFRGAK